jgi:hypothetical protein
MVRRPHALHPLTTPATVIAAPYAHTPACIMQHVLTGNDNNNQGGMFGLLDTLTVQSECDSSRRYSLDCKTHVCQVRWDCLMFVISHVPCRSCGRAVQAVCQHAERHR